MGGTCRKPGVSGCPQRSQASSAHQATVCTAPFLPTSVCPSSPGSGPDGFRVYPTTSASRFPGAATTQAPGISIGPQSAHLSPVAPRTHPRTSNGSRWLWAGALRTHGAKGALCLLAILTAFTSSLPKNDRGGRELRVLWEHVDPALPEVVCTWYCPDP